MWLLQSDWEASSDEEKKPAAVSAPVAPAKKKGSLKQKLAEKEAARQVRIAAGDGDMEYDEDAVLDPRAKARLEKEHELKSDLHHAEELFGSATIKGACPMLLRSRSCFKPNLPLHTWPCYTLYFCAVGSSDVDLDKILQSTPKTKEDFSFIALSDAIVAHVVK